jgi:hypothetical protein
VFVVGVWRSGTSLLHALLNQHPDIALMYEADLPLFWPMFTPHRKSWPGRINFWNSAFERHRLADAQESFAERMRLPEAAEAVYREFARRGNGRVWGDKSPTYSGHCARLARLFPQARFIVIWRDPEQVCSSVLRAAAGNSWFAKPGMITRALFSTEALKRDTDWLQQHGRAVYQLSYERLTGDTTAVMAEIADFLGIAYHPRMASLAGADRSAVYDGKHHALVKSERICASDEVPRLSGELSAKIGRYMALWSAKYGTEWPLYRGYSQGRVVEVPSLRERLRDVLSVLILKLRDGVVLIAYSQAPMGLLEMYRKRKRAPKAANTLEE